MKLTPAQQRLLDMIRSYGGLDGGAEYWPVMNDWVRDAGPASRFAHHNMQRSIDSLIRRGLVTLDDDGYLHLTGDAR